MKEILKSIIKKYKTSIIGWCITTLSLSIMIGLLMASIERDGTFIGNFLYVSGVVWFMVIDMTIAIIGIILMADGDDSDLMKVIKKKTDV